MKNPVCATCGVSFKVARNGVVLVEEYLTPPEPYKTWSADLLECPGCGARIVARFADEPTDRAGDGHIEDHILAAEQFGVVIRERERLGWEPTEIRFVEAGGKAFYWVDALMCNGRWITVGAIYDPQNKNPALALHELGFGFRGVRRILAEWEKEKVK